LSAKPANLLQLRAHAQKRRQLVEYLRRVIHVQRPLAKASFGDILIRAAKFLRSTNNGKCNYFSIIASIAEPDPGGFA
jgi:hypothetical protein